MANKMRYVTLISQYAAWFLLKKTGGEIFPPEYFYRITAVGDVRITAVGDNRKTADSA